MTGKTFRGFSAIAMGMAVFVMIGSPADARRGGSFGSRGARTAAQPPATATAPNQVAPVQRTMSGPQAAPNAMQNPAPTTSTRPVATAPGKAGGMRKSLLGGLVAGGLIAMLMGGGFGALAGSGFFTALMQAALIGGIIWLAMRMFRRSPTLAAASAPGIANVSPFDKNPPARMPQPMGFGKAMPNHGAAPLQTRSLAITMADKESFERLLEEVQHAFSSENYAALRACTTPEVMSYLAEELSQNAVKGLRNDVSGTTLLEAEVAEAWSEGDADYATIAMQYQSIEVLRDRATGDVVEGDPAKPTRTTELWTFIRDSRTPWRLSAIQEA